MGNIMARDRWGPVAVAVAAVLAGNLVVAALGLQGDAADPDPPGWFIGAVWVAIFACFGGAYAALALAPADTSGERAALVGLGALCLAYPFYTGLRRRGADLAQVLDEAGIGLPFAAASGRRSR
jgi:tryptophan-rich sensory protein